MYFIFLDIMRARLYKEPYTECIENWETNDFESRKHARRSFVVILSIVKYLTMILNIIDVIDYQAYHDYFITAIMNLNYILDNDGST